MKLGWMNPGRVIALGFGGLILVGTLLLMLPFAANPGVDIQWVDALFTSTSAVCVTGLIAIDTADYFSIFGRVVVALLIQLGGLGITSVGVAFILLTGKEIGLRERVWVREALNLNSMQGTVRLIRSVMAVTFSFELIGMALSYIVFSKNYEPLSALGISAFHAIAAFNNSGFDILGGYQSLTAYKDNVLLNLTTCGLIIFGGLGFYVIREIWAKRSWRALSMNTKIVLCMTAVLLAGGTLLLKLTDNITWMGAFFQSTSARTAGFATYPTAALSTAGQFVLIVLMFIGASPGSTGGGIKTTTAFTMYKSLVSYATNRPTTAFRRKIPHDSVLKAFMVTMLAVIVVCVMTFLIAVIEPRFTFMQIVLEVVSGFGTVGLSTGITPSLSPLSKLLLCLTMYIGRLGPLTMACIWVYKPSAHVSYGEEAVTIG